MQKFTYIRLRLRLLILAVGQAPLMMLYRNPSSEFPSNLVRSLRRSGGRTAKIQTQDPLPQKNWEIPAPQSMSPLGWKLNVQQAIPQTVYTRTGGE